jgi:hypothetical protein
VCRKTAHLAVATTPSPARGRCGGPEHLMEDYLRELDDHILVAVQTMLELIASLFA